MAQSANFGVGSGCGLADPVGFPQARYLAAFAPAPLDPEEIQIGPGRDMPDLGQPASTVRVVEYVDAKGVHTERAMFAKAGEPPAADADRSPGLRPRRVIATGSVAEAAEYRRRKQI